LKISNTKRAGEVAQVVGLSSSPGTTKTKQKQKPNINPKVLPLLAFVVI
jgi:hypothetical protein